MKAKMKRFLCMMLTAAMIVGTIPMDTFAASDVGTSTEETTDDATSTEETSEEETSTEEDESDGTKEITDSTPAAEAQNDVAAASEGGEEAEDTNNVAKIEDTGYTTFEEALTAASGMAGDVTVEIYDKVTLNTNLSGSYDSINFVGKDVNAEIYLEVQGYITAAGKKVAFEGLTLSKSAGGFIDNAGFMNVAFGVYDVSEVTYTNCTFANGAYASAGKVTYTNCTFYHSHDKYGLWAYGNVDVTVDECIFADYRGIKMYAEGAAKTVDLTVKSTNFSAVSDKPAIVLTYGESVTLENNTYSSTGTFELDLDGAPNGTAVASDVLPTCKNDNGACGVLVDGKIYTTVAQAVEVATSGSTVTLLHDSTENIELPEGVTLDKNGYTAADVTVATPEVVVAKIGSTEYTSLAEAMNAAKSGETVLLVADVDLAGTEWEPVSFSGKFDGQNHVISNLTINKPGVSNTGFITSLNGEFKNVTFTNPTVTGGECTGVVAGRAGGGAALAENITVNGTIKVETTHSGYARAGVIVGGWAYGNYKNITVNGGNKAVSYIKHTGGGDGRYVAGIVGHADDVDSYVNCTVKNITISGGWLCGGIAGPGPSNDLVSGCTVENIDVNADYSGGMFGWYYGDGTIENSTVKDVTFTDGSTNNGAIGGYSNNTAANLNNVTVENVKNKDGAPLLNHVAQIIRENETINCESVAAALEAAQDGETIKLLNHGTIAMNGAVYGKTVTITGTATVDWSKGNFFVGRGGEGNGTVIFDNANLTSASNNAATGIHVSGREKGTDDKYDGTLEIKNSTIELDYLINKGTMTLDSSTLTVKNGFSIGGRPAAETVSGEDATATITLNNGSELVVNNHNGMGVGYEAIGVMNVNEGCTFECTQDFLVTGKGTLNVNKGTVNAVKTLKVDGTLVSNGNISGNIAAGEEANIEISGGVYTQDVSQWCEEGYVAIADLSGNYVVGVKPTATVNNLGAMTIPAGNYMVYPSGDTSAAMPLSFVMQFLADQSEVDMETSPYADWYGDFVITFTGMENGSFTADGCYLAGHYGTFGWVKVPVDGMTIEDGKRYPVMLGVGMGQKYDYICSSVEDFKCALYLTPEILAANPDLEVTLELAVVDNSQGEDAAAEALVKNTNVYMVTAEEYTAEEFDENVAKIGDVKYKTLSEALGAAGEGDTVTLLKNVKIDETVSITKDLTIEGNGKTLTYTGTDRAIDVPNDTEQDIDVIINNLTIDCTANYCERGISYNENGTLVLDGVTVKGTNVTYALNMPGKAKNANVLIEDSQLKGCIALNVWGTDSQIVAMNSEFVSVDRSSAEGYSAVKLNNNGSTSAEGTEIIIIGGKIDAKDEKDAPSVATDNLTATGRIVVSNSTEVIGKHIESVALVLYKGVSEFYSCTTLQKAIDTAIKSTNNVEKVQLVKDINVDETINVNGTVTLDLNGHTITGTDKNVTGNFGLISINPGADLTIEDTVGTGKVTLEAETDRDWNAYSSVISNQRGKLTVNGGTIEHLGGTDMAYAIDNLTNGKGTCAETVINGGTVKSTYRAIRQFLNGVEAQNILTVNGGTIEGANKSIWMQDPNTNANPGKLTVGENAVLKGDVYLYVTSGSTEWPVEVSVAKAALNDSEIVTSNVPEEYGVVEFNGVYVVSTIPQAEVKVLEPMTLTAVEHSYMVWPSGDNTIDRPLDIVVNFKATETLDQAQASAFAEWPGDFYITVTGIENGTLTTDGDCYLAGNYGTYGWIVIPMDGVKITEGVANPIVSLYDANLTYENICDYVRDFTAAIHISDEIILANPNLKIELALQLKNPETEELLVIGEPAVYDAEDLRPEGITYVAAIGDTQYKTLEAAIEAAEDGQNINILLNIGTKPETTIDKALTIVNANGYTLWNESAEEALNEIVADGYEVTNVAGLNMIYTVTAKPVEAEPVAQIDEVSYGTVEAALRAAKSGDTVVMIADSDETGSDLILNAGITLNLGENELKARSLVGANGSYVYGDAYHAEDDYAKLKVETLRLGENAPESSDDFNLIPVWDPNQNYYVFSKFNIIYTGNNDGLTIDDTNKNLTLQFRQQLTGAVRTGLLSDNGGNDNKLSIVVKLTWENDNGVYHQEYVYKDEHVKFVAEKGGNGYYTFTLQGYDKLNLNLETLTIQAMAVTESGVAADGQVFTGELGK